MNMGRLYVVVRQQPAQSSDYKFLVDDSHYSYCAFKTNEGFRQFLQRGNLKLKYKDRWIHPDHGLCRAYDVIGSIEERSFWSLHEIPAGAQTFKAHSNGKLVDCFYLQTDTGATIYRPNPNAKNVYKPLPLEQHLAHQRRYG